jgi:hypothetical protein
MQTPELDLEKNQNDSILLELSQISKMIDDVSQKIATKSSRELEEELLEKERKERNTLFFAEHFSENYLNFLHLFAIREKNRFVIKKDIGDFVEKIYNVKINQNNINTIIHNVVTKFIKMYGESYFAIEYVDGIKYLQKKTKVPEKVIQKYVTDSDLEEFFKMREKFVSEVKEKVRKHYKKVLADIESKIHCIETEDNIANLIFDNTSLQENNDLYFLDIPERKFIHNFFLELMEFQNENGESSMKFNIKELFDLLNVSDAHLKNFECETFVPIREGMWVNEMYFESELCNNDTTIEVTYTYIDENNYDDDE